MWVLPFLNTETTYLTHGQMIAMAVTVYASTVMFITLLGFMLYNKY